MTLYKQCSVRKVCAVSKDHADCSALRIILSIVPPTRAYIYMYMFDSLSVGMFHTSKTRKEKLSSNHQFDPQLGAGSAGSLY